MNNNNCLLVRKVSWLKTLFPLLAGISIYSICCILSWDDFNITVFLWVQSLAILLIFFSRYNAVRLYMYEDYMIVDFYLLKKEIKVNYNQVKEALISSNRYDGTTIRFRVSVGDKKYTFRIDKFDTEFTNFLKSKVNYRISNN